MTDFGVTFYFTAFIAGFLTFFATCLLPVLPVYIGYLGGLSLDQRDSSLEKKLPFYRRSIFVHSLLFVAGFLLIFSTLGFAATLFGRLIATYRLLFQQIGAALLFLMGVSMLDIIRVPVFSRTFRLTRTTRTKSQAVSRTGAFIFGMTFGFAWTPCIGPVLAVILFFISNSTGSLFQGASLLAIFALGLGLPFVVVGIFFESLSPRLKKLGKWSHFLQVVFGIVIILMSILLFTNHISTLSQWTLHWSKNFGFEQLQ